MVQLFQATNAPPLSDFQETRGWDGMISWNQAPFVQLSDSRADSGYEQLECKC